MRRLSRILLALVVLLILSFSVLVGTTSGMHLIIQQVTKLAPQLAVGSVKGSLISEVELKTISWQSGNVSVAIDSIHLSPDWRCIWQLQLCFSSLELAKPVIVVKDMSEPAPVEEQAVTTNSLITSPVPVRLSELVIRDARFQLLSTVNDIESQQLNLTVSAIQSEQIIFYKAAEISRIGIENIVFQRSEQQNSVKDNRGFLDDLSGISQWQYRPPTLSDLSIPVRLNIEELEIGKIVEKQPGNALQLENLHARLAITENQMALELERLDWQQWQLSAQADITKKLVFSSSLKAVLISGQTINLPAANHSSVAKILPSLKAPISVELEASGSLQRIEVLGRLQDGNNHIISNLELALKPLDDLLPVDAKLNWAPLPLAEEQLWQFQGGEILVEGNLSEYKIALEAQNAILSSLTTPVNVNAQISVQADLTAKKADLHHITIATDFGEMTTAGQFLMDEQPHFDLQVDTSQITPGDWMELFSANTTANDSQQPKNQGPFSTLMKTLMFTSQARFSGEWLSPRDWHGKGSIDITGRWNNHPLTLANEFTLVSAGKQTGQWHLDLKKLLWQVADNQVLAKGGLTVDANATSYLIDQFETELTFNKLSQLLPGSRGEFTTSVALHGALNKPDTRAKIQAQDLLWQDLSLADMSLDFNLNWQDKNAFKLAGTMSGLAISDALVLDGDIQTHGDLTEHHIRLNTSSDKLSSQLKVTGGINEGRWQGILSEGRVSHLESTFALISAADMLFQWSPVAVGVSPHCWQYQLSALCFNQLEISNNRMAANVTGQDLPVFQWLRDLYTPLNDLETSSLLNFSSELDWQYSQFPEMDFSLTLSPGSWRFDKNSEFIAVDTLSSDITLKNRAVNAEVKLQGPDIGGVAAGVTWSSLAKWDTSATNNIVAIIDTWLAKSAIKGRVEARQLSLKPVSQWIPQIQHTQGRLHGTIEFESQWPGTRPLINGTLKLADAELVTEQLGLHFTHLNQQLRFDDYQASIDGGFTLGGGSGGLTGELNWQQEIAARFNVTGNELGYQDYRGSALAFSPDMHFSLADNVVKVEGKLAIPSADIKIQQLPESAILPSSDVQVNSEQHNEKTSSLPLTLSLAMNIDAAKTKRVVLEGYGLETALTGNLMLTGTPEKMALNGDINLLDGSYQAWGQQLLIREGQIIFSGPVDAPYLFAEAIRNPAYISDNVTAGLRIEGPVRKPSVSVFSQPELSQSQALSYLFRGQGLNSQQTGSDETLFTGMLLNFGLSQSESRVSRLGRKFGVQDLAIELSGQSAEAKVAVSGTVVPGLKLSYGVGVFDAISEVSLRYQLLPQLYLEAVSGLTSTVDIHYEFDDGPVPEPKTKATDTPARQNQ